MKPLFFLRFILSVCPYRTFDSIYQSKLRRNGGSRDGGVSFRNSLGTSFSIETSLIFFSTIVSSVGLWWKVKCPITLPIPFYHNYLIKKAKTLSERIYFLTPFTPFFFPFKEVTGNVTRRPPSIWVRVTRRVNELHLFIINLFINNTRRRHRVCIIIYVWRRGRVGKIYNKMSHGKISNKMRYGNVCLVDKSDSTGIPTTIRNTSIIKGVFGSYSETVSWRH